MAYTSNWSISSRIASTKLNALLWYLIITLIDGRIFSLFFAEVKAHLTDYSLALKSAAYIRNQRSRTSHMYFDVAYPCQPFPLHIYCRMLWSGRAFFCAAGASEEGAIWLWIVWKAEKSSFLAVCFLKKEEKKLVRELIIHFHGMIGEEARSLFCLRELYC